MRSCWALATDGPRRGAPELALLDTAPAPADDDGGDPEQQVPELVEARRRCVVDPEQVAADQAQQASPQVEDPKADQTEA